MKKTLLLAVIILNAITIYAQNKHDYNSFCIFQKDSISTYVCSMTDSISYTEENDGMFLQNIWQRNKQYQIPINEIDSVLFFNPYTSDIVINNDIVDWEEMYATPVGTFAYNSTLPFPDTDIDKEDYEILSYISIDRTRCIGVFFSRETKLPLRIETDSLAIFFSYGNDSVCTIMCGKDSTINAIGESEFSLFQIEKMINENNYNSNLKRCLTYLVEIAKESCLENYNNIVLCIKEFKSILDVKEVFCLENPSVWGSSDSKWKIYVSVYKSGEEPTKKHKNNILYSVVVFTNSYYNLKTTSCTASGSVRCAYSGKDKLGVYGIICDENPDNLVLGKAKYDIPAHQEKLSLSFKVNVIGLKPGTKYYYRAYYKLKNTNGPLVIKYNNRNPGQVNSKKASETYGDIKSFITLTPGASTGKVSNLSDKSATVECTYSNVPEGSVCGVKYTWADGSAKQSTGSGDGTKSITLNGLKPATAYTYCAYIEVNGETYYGEDKTFTTESPDISGSWECKEVHYDRTGAAYYVTYTVTLNKDGSVHCSNSGNILSSSWSLLGNGNVSIDIIDLATQTANSGVRWRGQVDSMEHPTKITGSTNRWNYNNIGVFEGEYYEFEMKR